MTVVDRLRRWADARERRDPRHGKKGTRLLRAAADIIEDDTLTEAELRILETQLGDLIEVFGGNRSQAEHDLLAKLNRMIRNCMRVEDALDNQEWPEYAAAMDREADGPDLNSDDLYETLRGDHDQLD